jgi:hypothetical protein
VAAVISRADCVTTSYRASEIGSPSTRATWFVICFRKGYYDANSFKGFGAILAVIRCAAPDSLGSD